MTWLYLLARLDEEIEMDRIDEFEEVDKEKLLSILEEKMEEGEED